MDLSAFDYELPSALIAQTPAPRRDGARLLVVDRGARRVEDAHVLDLPSRLRAGDCLVINDSRVIPARVMAETEDGRRVELLFVAPLESAVWRALVRPGRRCRPGVRLRVGLARLRVLGIAGDGTRTIGRDDGAIAPLLEAHGQPPLPPYIARHAVPSAEDRERYQTVYARDPGSVAAPTAGLHFTHELLDALRGAGVEVHAVTLHVGPATFRPVTSVSVEGHVIEAECAVVPSATADAVNRARAAGRRVVAVGTTTVRALESAVDSDGRVAPLCGAAGLTIRPGHRFQAVDAMLTNFHLPRSSLLLLVAAFAGRDLVLAAYRHAVAAGYRFYSYGDATLIV